MLSAPLSYDRKQCSSGLSYPRGWQPRRRTFTLLTSESIRLVLRAVCRLRKLSAICGSGAFERGKLPVLSRFFVGRDLAERQGFVTEVGKQGSLHSRLLHSVQDTQRTQLTWLELFPFNVDAPFQQLVGGGMQSGV
jgi:hypothetical protein